jgi:hypothetical protein
MKYLLALVLVLCLVGVAQAVEPKVSYFWEASDSEFIKLIGCSVKEDVIVKGLDIDVWYKWAEPATEVKYDELGLNNLVMPGVSYSKEVMGWDIGLNAAAGLDRIESITDSKDIGEFKYGIGIIVGKKI